MRIETKLLTELKPAPYNPRVALQPGMPAYERLKRSLAEFELVQPLVWNRRTGHVVGGHQRLAVMQELGHTEATVVVVDLELEHEKALNITLNNEQVAGCWDYDKLQDVLHDLIELPEFDETLTGFSEQEMKQLLLRPAIDWEPENDDESPGGDKVQVTIRIEPEDWEEVRVRLDELLQDYDLEFHMRMPE